MQRAALGDRLRTTGIRGHTPVEGPGEVFPAAGSSAGSRFSAAGFSVTGQGPKRRGVGGRDTPGLDRKQIPRGENCHTESLRAGAVPLALRVQGHRLPGHHFQTLTVSVPGLLSRLRSGCGHRPLTCPSSRGRQGSACLRRAPRLARLLWGPFQGKEWQLDSLPRPAPEQTGPGEGEELLEGRQGRPGDTVCGPSWVPHTLWPVLSVAGPSHLFITDQEQTPRAHVGSGWSGRAGLGEGAAGRGHNGPVHGDQHQEPWLLPSPVLGAHFADGETELSKCSLM